ncbi:MAG: tail fiber protein [Gammaproteobacteria bacterium]
MLKKSLENRSITALISASALTMGIGFSQPAQASEPFLAEIVMFGGNFAPRSWALCQGQILSINSNQALFSLLGTTYGGDGRTTFGLPDLRGRSPIGAGNGPGLAAYSLGQKGGTENHTLSVGQTPSHNHGVTLNATNERGDSEFPNDVVGDPPVEFRNVLATKARTKIYKVDPPEVGTNSTVPMSSKSITQNNMGGNQQFSLRDPYLAVNFIIATQGTFPSRN